MRASLAGLALAGLAATAAAQESVDSAMVRFYAARWYQTAWVQANGISPQADDLLDVLAQSAGDGLDPADYLMPALDSLLHQHLSPADAWQLDSLLTRAFFTYARDVSHGRVEPAAVDSQWTAAPASVDFVAILERALGANRIGAVQQELAPPQPGYRALRAALERYRDLARHGGWPTNLSRRLTAEGFASLRDFQRAHGLAADGIVGPETRAALAVAAAERVRQIELNLERWRWLPRSLGERYLLVNSAAFALAVIDHNTIALSMRAVVGRLDWPTPIVSSNATHLVFRPVWNVPRAIAATELLPSLQRDSTLPQRLGIRVFGDSTLGNRELDPRTIDWAAVTESSFTYRLSQEPGPDNPLGGVKLVFWTRFSVFIHDTPARPLFSERWRIFSHGCVRVEDALSLAAYLLPQWPADSLRGAMREGRERWVRLDAPIPVHLVYWTAWVDDSGVVQFRDDIYGWDARLDAALIRRPYGHEASAADHSRAGRTWDAFFRLIDVP